MDCREFVEKVSLYIDNQLENVEKNQFELHLQECDDCKKSYEEMVEILKLTSEAEEEELPINYKDTLRSKLEEEAKENKKKKVNWRLVSSIAASFILLVASYGFILNNINLFGTNEQTADDSAPSDIGGYGNSADYGESEQSEAPTIDSVRGLDNNSIKITFSESLNADLSDKNMSRENFLTATDESNEQDQDEKSTGVKIIKEAHLTLEIKEYDNALNTIVSFVKGRNGYIERSETWYADKSVKSVELDKVEQLKRGNIRIRIPEDSFYEGLVLLKDQGKVSNEQTSETDISQSYYDTANVIKNLEVQEVRLREILEKAENVDEILRVEYELNRVRTDIDRNQGTINNWDSLVNYSTISVTLVEIENKTETIQKVDKGIFAKGKEGFISTINSLIDLLERAFIKLMTVLPVIFIIVTFIILAIVLIRKAFKRREP